MADTTVIYYSNNRETPAFVNNVTKALISNSGGLPIISVTQKPMELGDNVCVGDVGVSGHNTWRQFQIGAMRAETKFVCTAEADMIHPPDYFRFEPPREDVIYMAEPLYVLFAQSRKSIIFARKSPSEAAMVVGRRHVIGLIEKMLEGRGRWKANAAPDLTCLMYSMCEHAYFTLSAPVLTIKTDNNMHRATPYRRSSVVRRLPYWGEAHRLAKRLFRG